MRTRILVLAPIAIAVAMPVHAQSPATSAQPQAATAPELICRRVEETGSLVKKKKKVCYTREEWDRIAAMSRDAMGQGAMSGGTSGQ
jgi:hypothetical protein